MSLWQRLRNLWELSEDDEELPLVPEKEEGKVLENKKVYFKDVFIPRNSRDPVKEITQEKHDD